MAVHIDFLKSIPYFAGLSSAELEAISQRAIEKRAERGEIVIYDGEPAQSIYFVISGAIKVFKTSVDGKEQILNIIRPGESFNDVPIFDDGVNPATAQAMGPVTLCEIRKSEFNSLLRGNTHISANTIKILAGHVRQLVSLVEDLSFKHVIGRVAKILLTAGDGDDSGPRLTQQEMAAIAGSAREVIGRSLKALESEGMIRLNRHRIVITDMEALRERAESTV